MSKPTIRASKKPEKEIRQQQQENGKESRVEICGDSMTKYIQAHKFGRSINDRDESHQNRLAGRSVKI